MCLLITRMHHKSTNQLHRATSRTWNLKILNQWSLLRLGLFQKSTLNTFWRSSEKTEKSRNKFKISCKSNNKWYYDCSKQNRKTFPKCINNTCSIKKTPCTTACTPLKHSKCRSRIPSRCSSKRIRCSTCSHRDQIATWAKTWQSKTSTHNNMKDREAQTEASGNPRPAWAVHKCIKKAELRRVIWPTRWPITIRGNQPAPDTCCPSIDRMEEPTCRRSPALSLLIMMQCLQVPMRKKLKNTCRRNPGTDWPAAAS